MKIQSNLSIAATEGTGQKWPLYTGGRYREVNRYRQVWQQFEVSRRYTEVVALYRGSP